MQFRPATTVLPSLDPSPAHILLCSKVLGINNLKDSSAIDFVSQEIRAMLSVEREIRQFIIENFLFGEVERSPSNDDSLIEQGIVDSTGVVELVAFLESKYGIEIRADELIPANLDSLNKLLDFVARKTAIST
jgi:acyl carrier protein